MTKAWEITRKNITGTDFGLRGFKLSNILDGWKSKELIPRFIFR